MLCIVSTFWLIWTIHSMAVAVDGILIHDITINHLSSGFACQQNLSDQRNPEFVSEFMHIEGVAKESDLHTNVSIFLSQLKIHLSRSVFWVWASDLIFIVFHRYIINYTEPKFQNVVRSMWLAFDGNFNWNEKNSRSIFYAINNINKKRLRSQV